MRKYKMLAIKISNFSQAQATTSHPIRQSLNAKKTVQHARQSASLTNISLKKNSLKFSKVKG